jgi:hypothetical protein
VPLAGILMLVVLALAPAAFAASHTARAFTRPVSLRVTVDDTTPGMGQRLSATAQLYDQYGRPVCLPGVRVSWSRYGSGGTVSLGTTFTGVSGSACISLIVPLQYGGAFGVRAAASNWSVSGATTYLPIGAGPVARFWVTQGGGTLPLTLAVVGQPLLVRVTAQDAWGHTATEYVGNVSLTSNCFTGSVTVSIGQARALAGAGRTSRPPGGWADTQVWPTVPPPLQATFSCVARVSGVFVYTSPASAGFTVQPGPAASLRVEMLPSATVGRSVAATVTALDAYGNTATGYRGTARFTSTDASATLPPAYAFTAGDAGIHSFTGGVTFATAGTQRVTATDAATASITGTSGPVTVFASGTTLTSVAPTSGPVAGGASVTLTGTGFTGAISVRFGVNTATSFVVNSATQITAVSPAGTGTVQVGVITPGGISNSLPYTYVAAPVLISLAPSYGPPAGATTVVITGTGLTGATAVTFGATPATSFTVNSATQITATSPAGTGSVQVTVTTPLGTSNGVPYTYVAAPVIYETLKPIQGPAAGGNTVTIYGRNLSGVTAVTFGARAATSVVFASGDDSYGSVTATAPSGTGGVQVTVTTPGGTSNSAPYTYVPAPVLTLLAPSSGDVGPNTIVITGTGLTGATAVTANNPTPGDISASSFTVVSDTEISADFTFPSALIYTVTVTTVGGVSNGLSFSVAP